MVCRHQDPRGRPHELAGVRLATRTGQHGFRLAL